MGKTYSVCNDTGYTWYHNTKSGEYRSLAPGANAVFKVGYPIYLRYENHKEADLQCHYGGYKYTIRECRNSSRFQLLCGTKGHYHVCPHFAEKEKCLQQQRREQEQLEQQRRQKEQLEQQRREQRRLEQQRREKEQLEQQRQEKERLEQQRREKERLEQQRREKERLQQQRREQERLEQQRREKEQREQQRQEKERLEQQRREKERLEQQRREKERLQQQRREQQRLEQQRREKEQLEQQRREKERLQQQRWEKERLQQQRREQQQLKQQRREKERLEQQRQEKERLEQQRREKERLEQQRREKELQELLRQQKQEQQELRELQKQEHNQMVYIDQGQVTPTESLDELSVVEQKFADILMEFKITEDKVRTVGKLEDRMKMLQNELMTKYFGVDSLTFSSLLAIERAFGYENLTLTERLNVVRAMLQLLQDGVSGSEDYLSASKTKEHIFLLSLLKHMQKENPDLAVRILYSVTETVSALTSDSRLILGHILFNGIWTPVEILLFLQRVVKSPSSKVTAVLEIALTYRLSCSSVLSALQERDPINGLRQQVESEDDKDLDTLISEMREANYPETILNIVEDVLRHVKEELAKLSNNPTLNKDQIHKGKKRICSLDLDDPDIACLQQVLIFMSIAVKECTKVTTTGLAGWLNMVQVQGYFPRLTQLASLLVLLLPQARGEKGRLLEISTGEGKTCILAMFAAIQAIRGIKPDIVTSSPVLANRDQKQWKNLFSKLGLTSSVVPPNKMTNENFEELVKEAYSQDIVYGIVGTFAADTLRQDFEGETTRGTRRFEMVIVDEVDYMTLDNGVQITFLSHQDSILRHMEQVLAGIWVRLSACRPIEMMDSWEINWISRPQFFHKTVVSALDVSECEDFSIEDILQLGVNLKIFSQNEIDDLVKADCKGEAHDAKQDLMDTKLKTLEKIMNKIGPAELYKLLREFEKIVEGGDLFEYFSVTDNKAIKYGEILHSQLPKDKVKLLLLERGCACQIMAENNLISWTVDNLKSKIKYSDECDPMHSQEIKDFIVIPSFLKAYTEQLLPQFAENALRAIVMVEGREYLIEKGPEAEAKDEDDSKSHQYDAIIPVDFVSSGVLQKNTKWGDGLQQFLEMKHCLAISPLTTVTNYMSNIHYFEKYLSGEGIFGVSGTLGGDAEKSFLSEHYKINSYVIPNHRRKKVVELPALQVQGGNRLWIERVCETAKKVADRGQVVLIICEDVKTANDLHREMQKNQMHPITMYTVSGRHEIENQTFSGGNIIIATNLAGRGTDIRIDPKVNTCGGLFVLLTYFPTSQRVEKQVFGRTGRKGNPGKVQMILNTEQLESAYQGQSVDIIRQLREQSELNHIKHMEKEFHVINLKQKLFSTFCGFLDDFRNKYTEREKINCDGININNVPECFKSYRAKFDYHPAVSSLKESWAFWLIQQEAHIREDWKETDIQELMENLQGHLQQRSSSLLKGKSRNFHDHIKQAASRTDLHRCNRRECYGAKQYWQDAAESDPFFSAVALYNKAYVTINLRKKGYMSEGKELLKKAQDLVDVFLSETTNTMIFCSLSSKSDFKIHHENSNLLLQMQVRMNIFKSWKGYIESALEKIVELQKSRDDAITEDSSTFSLLEEKDFVTANELRKMYSYGLGIVFEVKRKPRFSFDSLICFFIGVLQVLGGTLVCAFSFGAATNIGLGLISEGVSDMISGTIGIFKGSFSWADWAISKSISIGVSLVCGGLQYLGKHGLNGLKNTRTLIHRGVTGIVSGTRAVPVTVMQVIKHAAKYTAQELGKQGVLAAVNHGMDKGFKAIFKEIFQSAFKEKVLSLVRKNKALADALIQFISQEVPKEAIQTKTDNFEIDPESKKSLHKSVVYMTTEVIPQLLKNLTRVHEVINILHRVANSALRVLEKNKASKIVATITKTLSAAQYMTSVIEMLKAVPTEGIINDEFIPQFLTKMEHLKKDEVKDGRQNLTDVKRLKEDFIQEIAECVSEAFVNAFVEHLASITSRITSSKVNHKIGKCVENVLGRQETQRFFDDQRRSYKLRVATQAPVEPLPKAEKQELLLYVKSLDSYGIPATALHLHILTESNLLEGKGIRIIVTNEQGKALYEEYYPGRGRSHEDITLQLVKSKDTSEQNNGGLSALSKRIRGEHQPYTGHFRVVHPDGTTSNVDSEGQNCLFHAIVQANTDGHRDVNNLRKDAAKLRRKCSQELQQNIPQNAALLRLHRQFEESYKNPGLFTIIGGTKKTRVEDTRKFLDAINTSNLSRGQIDEMRTFHLGMVAEHRDLKSARKCSNNEVNADHIPPKDSYLTALRILDESPRSHEELKNKRPNLYEELRKIQHNTRGDTLLCMEVRTEHHKQALTTGNSGAARICRREIAKGLAKGDMQETLKKMFIVSHPTTSQSLKQDAGINSNTTSHSADYYEVGFRLMIEKHYDKGFIDSSERDRLVSWVNDERYKSQNTQEYKSLKRALSQSKMQNKS